MFGICVNEITNYLISFQLHIGPSEAFLLRINVFFDIVIDLKNQNPKNIEMHK